MFLFQAPDGVGVVYTGYIGPNYTDDNVCQSPNGIEVVYTRQKQFRNINRNKRCQSPNGVEVVYTDQGPARRHFV